MVNTFSERRDFMVKRLNEIEGISCKKPRGAIYTFPNISKLKKSSYDIAEFLLKKGKVNTVYGAAFGKQGEGHLRLSFATSTEDIEEGMDRIEKTLKKHK
jgi:aspartate/methionine/tyrosine aminotransferase